MQVLFFSWVKNRSPQGPWVDVNGSEGVDPGQLVASRNTLAEFFPHCALMDA